MKKEELFGDIDISQAITEKYLGLSLGKFLILLTIVVSFGIYIGTLLYGTSSLEVLLELQDYEEYLQNEIKHIKTENANLQREYFELKEISAE